MPRALAGSKTALLTLHPMPRHHGPMGDKEKPSKPHLPAEALDPAERRRRRLAAALRENLKKRKDQARARAANPRSKG